MRPDPRALLALVVLGGLGTACVLGPILAPYDPLALSGSPLQPPGPRHPFGTNDVGQDIWSQWLWAARASLVVAASIALLSGVLSWSMGLLAGLWRVGAGPLVAVFDLLLALPELPLYLLVVALVGGSRLNLVLTLGLLSWAGFARVVRARVLVVRGEAYVEAARALGGTPLHVAMRHVLPATKPLVPAKLMLTVRFALFAEATLAFLGLGDSSAPTWGTMLGWAFSNPLLFAGGRWAWSVLPPALGIVAAVLATSLVATWLEDRSFVPARGRGIEKTGEQVHTPRVNRLTSLKVGAAAD